MGASHRSFEAMRSFEPRAGSKPLFLVHAGEDHFADLVLERVVVPGPDADDVVEVEGDNGGVETDEGEGLFVPAVVGVAGGIGDGAGAEEVVVGEEVRDVLAEGILGNLVGVGLLGRHLLRGEMHLERAGLEVQEEDAVAGRAGGIGVGLRLPRVLVGVVEDYQSDTLRERRLERLQVPPVVFAELPDVEDVAAVDHEVVVGRMDAHGDAFAVHRLADVPREGALPRAGNGAVHDDGRTDCFHVPKSTIRASCPTRAPFSLFVAPVDHRFPRFLRIIVSEENNFRA